MVTGRTHTKLEEIVKRDSEAAASSILRRRPGE